MAWRWTEGHTRNIGGSSSQPSGSGINCGLRQSFTTRKAKIPSRDIVPYMFPRKQNQLKAYSQLRMLKKSKNSWQNSSTTMQYHSMQLIVILTTKP